MQFQSADPDKPKQIKQLHGPITEKTSQYSDYWRISNISEIQPWVYSKGMRCAVNLTWIILQFKIHNTITQEKNRSGTYEAKSNSIKARYSVTSFEYEKTKKRSIHRTTQNRSWVSLQKAFPIHKQTPTDPHLNSYRTIKRSKRRKNETDRSLLGVKRKSEQIDNVAELASEALSLSL